MDHPNRKTSLTRHILRDERGAMGVNWMVVAVGAIAVVLAVVQGIGSALEPGISNVSEAIGLGTSGEAVSLGAGETGGTWPEGVPRPTPPRPLRRDISADIGEIPGNSFFTDPATGELNYMSPDGLVSPASEGEDGRPSAEHVVFDEDGVPRVVVPNGYDPETATIHRQGAQVDTVADEVDDGDETEPRDSILTEQELDEIGEVLKEQIGEAIAPMFERAAEDLKRAVEDREAAAAQRAANQEQRREAIRHLEALSAALQQVLNAEASENPDDFQFEVPDPDDFPGTSSLPHLKARINMQALAITAARWMRHPPSEDASDAERRVWAWAYLSKLSADKASEVLRGWYDWFADDDGDQDTPP